MSDGNAVDRLVQLNEAKEFLGVRSLTTVYKLAKADPDLQIVKRGRNSYLRMSGIQRHIAKLERKS